MAGRCVSLPHIAGADVGWPKTVCSNMTSRANGELFRLRFGKKVEGLALPAQVLIALCRNNPQLRTHLIFGETRHPKRTSNVKSADKNLSTFLRNPVWACATEGFRSRCPDGFRSVIWGSMMKLGVCRCGFQRFL